MSKFIYESQYILNTPLDQVYRENIQSKIFPRVEISPINIYLHPKQKEDITKMESNVVLLLERNKERSLNSPKQQRKLLNLLLHST